MTRAHQVMRLGNRASNVMPADDSASPAPERFPSEAETSGERIGLLGGVRDANAAAPTPLLLNRLAVRSAQKVVTDTKTMTASREQYRRLAASLHQAQTSSGVKVVMVASAVPDEGKTLTATNLALTFSESYRRHVLLIDADLRHPSLQELFEIPAGTGLGEGLATAQERTLTVHYVSPRLAVLPAGHPSSDPMAGLTSERMRRLIVEAREMFDWVILDTPPVGLLPDANLLASFVDSTIIVVRAGWTPFELVQRTVETIGRERTLGIVLNRLLSMPQPYYGYLQYEHKAR
jgi:capsular exopolysaccharide synthesis family protein